MNALFRAVSSFIMLLCNAKSENPSPGVVVVSSPRVLPLENWSAWFALSIRVDPILEMFVTIPSGARPMLISNHRV